MPIFSMSADQAPAQASIAGPETATRQAPAASDDPASVCLEVGAGAVHIAGWLRRRRAS